MKENQMSTKPVVKYHKDIPYSITVVDHPLNKC